MKTGNYLLFALLLIISISIILSCSNSTGPNDNHTFPAAIDSVATDITLYVYSGGLLFGGKAVSIDNISALAAGPILDTIEMATEGSITIDIEDHNSYLIYAKADGFYTAIYNCTKGNSITVDLDAVPQIANSVTGAVFEVGGFYFSDSYHDKKDIAIVDADGNIILSKTDSLGRYGFGNLSADQYTLYFPDSSSSQSYNISNTNGTDYNDIYFSDDFIIEAPNLYLYPEKTSDISISIDFPNGGQIVASEPAYNNGWDVNVTSDGIIDGQYEYLFYETRQSMILNSQSGWLLDGADLENELRHLLMNLGFVGREIDDFIDYWLPQFGTTPYLAVYPQEVETMISVNIVPTPNEFLRMIFLFRPLSAPIQLEELPLPDAIQRNGFTAVEWGGILASD